MDCIALTAGTDVEFHDPQKFLFEALFADTVLLFRIHNSRTLFKRAERD